MPYPLCEPGGCVTQSAHANATSPLHCLGAGKILWRFQLKAEPAGTTVIESYEVVKPVSIGLQWMLRILFGVRSLEIDLNNNMRTSLTRLAEIANREASSRPSSLT